MKRPPGPSEKEETGQESEIHTHTYYIELNTQLLTTSRSAETPATSSVSCSCESEHNACAESTHQAVSIERTISFPFAVCLSVAVVAIVLLINALTNGPSMRVSANNYLPTSVSLVISISAIL